MQGLYLSCLPAGHYSGFGFLVRPSIYGAPSVFMDQWDAAFAAEIVERHRVRHSGGTPIFLLTLLRVAEEHGIDLSSLESFGMGGASMTPSLIRSAEEKGFPAARVYGSTEHPTVTRFDPALPFEKRAFTDGPVDEGNEVRVVDEEGRDLPLGREGEIATRGPDLFAGYSDPQLDAESFLPGGWFKTGDVGRLDGEGFLTVTDRKQDIVIRGGENISSREVEEVLAQHPCVAEVAVTAMPDETYGEKVCAFVIPKPGRTLTLAEVVAHFQGSGLAKQKTPERLEIVEALPRTATGKVKKHELREQLRRGRGEPA
jgi:non-ribosomal peptide synthetase component E (peptide arylation enzyme)